MRFLPLALVWNRRERRLRALWRLVLTLVFVAVLIVAAGFVLVPALRSAEIVLVSTLGSATADVALLALSQWALGGVITATVLLAGIFLDRRRLADFGFRFDRDWWLDLAFGLALGAALMTLVFLFELAVGWVRVTGTFETAGGPFAPSFLFVLALFLFVGVYEELFARGYLLTNVAEGLRGFGPLGERAAVAVAVLVSSVAFGLLHAENPSATTLSTFNISLAGVFLALGYVLTNELSIPIGVHITWNFFQGAVYGFPVSGLGRTATVVAVEQRGPPAATGGSFGPEAGLVGVAAILLGCLAIAGWCEYRYGHVAIHPGLTLPDLRWRE
ncbi:CPBP family intramembrane glutamic endopeptidase [Halegenticoccus tardaugens]|uniref:CPBP family intramembrane glutamic endopeptidase n=1 Tax=Halegenticoccus tardaugens TaxID=2071624 RepID=UPI00100A80A0|nr:CPBP family intramembrane glutamic endopeptidase [Halegenticoccus tardaugens]